MCTTDKQTTEIQFLVTYIRRLDGQDEIPSRRRDEIVSWGPRKRDVQIFETPCIMLWWLRHSGRLVPHLRSSTVSFSTNIQNFRINSELKNGPDSLISETRMQNKFSRSIPFIILQSSMKTNVFL